MRSLKTLVATWSAVVVTLVTLGTMPAFAASQDDAQAPRDTVRATLSDAQAPRGQDAQAPRGQDAQAPRGQEDQAPATLDDTQSPRGARS